MIFIFKMNSNIKITKIIENIYCIEELNYLEHCNCYLVVGTKKCLLIDTGIGLIDFQSLLNPIIKNKELITIISHFHFDHIGGTNQFKKIFANKVDLDKKDMGLKYLDKKDFISNWKNKKIQNLAIIKKKIFQIENGSMVDLGNFKFKVIFTPGHDKTSISLFEKNKKIIFTGDLIYKGKLYFDFKDSDKMTYVKSLKKILKLGPKVICGGHNKPITGEVPKFIKSKILSIN